MKRHLAALQAVSRLRQAEAAEIASEGPETPPNADSGPFWDSVDPITGWTNEDWRKWDAWCTLEDERITRLHAEEAEAERERYRLARISRTNPHD